MPKDAFVRINGEVFDLKKQQRISLEEGTYSVEIWAPRFATVKKEIKVTSSRPLIVKEGLKQTAASFDDYQERIAEHNGKRFRQNLRDGTVLGLFAGFTTVALTGRRAKLRKLEDEVGLRRAAYASAVSLNQIENVTQVYNDVVNEYEETEASHNLLVVSTGVLAALTAAFAVRHFTAKTRYRGKRPAYIPDSPFSSYEVRKRSSLHLGTSSSLIGFTLKF